jgi:hypothetical protein
MAPSSLIIDDDEAIDIRQEAAGKYSGLIIGCDGFSCDCEGLLRNCTGLLQGTSRVHDEAFVASKTSCLASFVACGFLASR